MKYWNVMACPVHFWAGVKYSAVSTSQFEIIYIIYFIHSVQDDLPKVFIEPIGFTVESIPKDIIFDIVVDLFLRKMFSKVSSERVQIIIINEFLSHILEVLFHSSFESILGISNVKFTTVFARDLVNSTTSTTFTSL